MTQKPGIVVVTLYEGVETLDFCGPLSVFSLVGKKRGRFAFRVVTAALQRTPLTTDNGLTITPTHDRTDCPSPEVLVVPGGEGSRREIGNPDFVSWIAELASQANIVLSVCTGALLIAKAGILKGLAATTYQTAFDLLTRISPDTRIRPGKRYVDNGRIVTSAGIAAGLDASLFVVEKLLGRPTAQETADYMEYPWQRESRADASPQDN